MGSTLDQAGKKVMVAEIVHSGEQLILPITPKGPMPIPDAISLLERRMKYLEEKVALTSKFNVFPWDGANALDVVLTRTYGWTPAEATPGFFGDQPPKMINIDVDLGKTKTVPWGRFSLPGIKGYIETGVAWEGDRLVFAINGTVTRNDESAVKKLFADVANELKVGSIYRGKAIKMRFKDNDGDMLPMPEPKFLDTTVDENGLIYPETVMNAVNTSLFTPIRRWKDLKANGIAIKRGVLLGGVFGTGKTLAAKVASKLAVENGVTYLYVPRADELSHAVEFAKQYSETEPCVIFCEDIDRALGGDRSVEIDDILNIVDGIDTKNSNIIIVLTTNNLDGINQAMLRPGRLDAVIDVLPPDAQAAEKLVRLYGGAAIESDLDLTEVGKILNGTIPAIIAEVVKRAKLSQLARLKPGQKVTKIGVDALTESAMTMQAQIELLKPRGEEEKPSVENILKSVVDSSLKAKLG